MREKITAMITSLRRKFYCECGYKTNNATAFSNHIAKHPNVPATVDFETGAIVW